MSKWGEGSGHAEGSKGTQFPHQKNCMSGHWKKGEYPGGGRKMKWTEEACNEEAKLLWEWMQEGKNYFFHQFATERGYPVQNLYVFCERSEEFAYIYKLAKDWQANKLAMCGLRKIFDPGFTKFMLINHHDYKDKTETVTESAHSLKFLLTEVDGETKDLVDDDRL
jgi:hypothetical protein